MDIEFSKALASTSTPIPGLVLFDVPVHGDSRGWFKENWQRTKMADAGLTGFEPVQNNISFNESAGTTRGIHAEPWDKFISVATGRIFGAWVDLRDGPTFGVSFTMEIDPSTAIFVPRGVGNAFQTLEPGTAYTYLVNDHWSPHAQDEYTFLNLADPTVNIAWPIPLAQAQLSDKDRNHPYLPDLTPMAAKKVLVLGANGQLGKALRLELTGTDTDTVEYATRTEFDLAASATWEPRNWKSYSTIINAAAYTDVDTAETPEGRRTAWAVNVTGLAALTRIAAEHNITLVHVSSDYVFDGTTEEHTEDEPLSPLGVYGQTKAAADALVSTLARHYIVRTSWVVGQGNNFVKTMTNLATRGIAPSVVNDQHGRLTFTTDIAAAIKHLLATGAAYGTYNLTNTGPAQSWADIAKTVYTLTVHNPDDVTPVSTEEYYVGKPHAPRPMHSTLNLNKIQATGFSPRTADAALRTYLESIDGS